MGALQFGDRAAELVSQRVAAPVATLTVLKTYSKAQRIDGMIAMVLADGSLWRFSDASALTGDDLLIATPADAPAAGRWLRMTGAVDLAIPITFATADAAAILTVQAGTRLAVQSVAWEVTADFTGGSSSAIGVSSNKTTPTNWSTKGDVLGGSGGDVLATLVASGGYIPGTIGADMDTLTKVRGLVLVSTDTLKFDRITSIFTAGTGFVHVLGNLIKNAGA